MARRSMVRFPVHVLAVRKQRFGPCLRRGLRATHMWGRAEHPMPAVAPAVMKTGDASEKGCRNEGRNDHGYRDCRGRRGEHDATAAAGGHRRWFVVGWVGFVVGIICHDILSSQSAAQTRAISVAPNRTRPVSAPACVASTTRRATMRITNVPCGSSAKRCAWASIVRSHFLTC